MTGQYIDQGFDWFGKDAEPAVIYDIMLTERGITEAELYEPDHAEDPILKGVEKGTILL